MLVVDLIKIGLEEILEILPELDRILVSDRTGPYSIFDVTILAFRRQEDEKHTCCRDDLLDYAAGDVYTQTS